MEALGAAVVHNRDGAHLLAPTKDLPQQSATAVAVFRKASALRQCREVCQPPGLTLQHWFPSLKEGMGP